MCVEETVLSAYVDQELSEKEAHTVEEHLQSCDRCRATIERLQRVKKQLREGDKSSLLAGDGSSLSSSAEQVRERIRRKATLGRRPYRSAGVYLPLPAALAAAALLLLLTGALIGVSLQKETGEPRVAEETTEREMSAAAVHDAEIEELIRFLSSQGASLEVRIELPPSSQFSVRGEPRLIRADEFEGY
jgi:anti-sigma factor RsiW